MSNTAILCVDDESMILTSLELEFQAAFGNTYLYEFAESADEALELIEELSQADIQIMLIVTDWLMPGMKGDEFLVHVHQKYDKIINIMLTGQADEAAVERARSAGNLYACIYKPWDSQSLITTIKSALATS